MPRGISPLKPALTATLTGLALGGCLGTGPTTQVADVMRLAESGSGVLLLHTSFHDGTCAEITASLAKPVMSGRSVGIGREVALNQRSETGRVPGQMVLPAGEYGIVRLACEGGDRPQVVEARAVERGSSVDDVGTVYESALATFRIGPGEIVDGGSLRVTTAPAAPASLAGSPVDGPIRVTVGTMPDGWLQRLAARYPHFAGNRVVRPLVPATPRLAAAEPLQR